VEGLRLPSARLAMIGWTGHVHSARVVGPAIPSAKCNRHYSTGLLVSTFSVLGGSSLGGSRLGIGEG
jgi:hypothetical protein